MCVEKKDRQKNIQRGSTDAWNALVKSEMEGRKEKRIWRMSEEKRSRGNSGEGERGRGMEGRSKESVARSGE